MGSSKGARGGERCMPRKPALWVQLGCSAAVLLCPALVPGNHPYSRMAPQRNKTLNLFTGEHATSIPERELITYENRKFKDGCTASHGFKHDTVSLARIGAGSLSGPVNSWQADNKAAVWRSSSLRKMSSAVRSPIARQALLTISKGCPRTLCSLIAQFLLIPVHSAANWPQLRAPVVCQGRQV